MSKVSRKHDPEFMDLLAKSATIDPDTGCIKLTGIYGNLCVNIGWKGKIIVVPYSHLVWLLTYGRWPGKGNHIDHINDDALDNRPSNLQEISEEENHKKRRGRTIYRTYGKGKYGHGFNLHHDKRDGRWYLARYLPRACGDGDLRSIRVTLGGFGNKADAEAKIKEQIELIAVHGVGYLPSGVKRNPKAATMKLDATAYHMRELRNQGKSLAAIAKMTGFKIGAVYRRVKDMGIDNRTPTKSTKRQRARLIDGS